eukprot:scpid97894/ scgid18186/ 
MAAAQTHVTAVQANGSSASTYGRSANKCGRSANTCGSKARAKKLIKEQKPVCHGAGTRVHTRVDKEQGLGIQVPVPKTKGRNTPYQAIRNKYIYYMRIVQLGSKLNANKKVNSKNFWK